MADAGTAVLHVDKLELPLYMLLSVFLTPPPCPPCPPCPPLQKRDSEKIETETALKHLDDNATRISRARVGLDADTSRTSGAHAGGCSESKQTPQKMEMSTPRTPHAHKSGRRNPLGGQRMVSKLARTSVKKDEREAKHSPLVGG